MRLTREESRERTRERLIEAAQACLARQGYDGTSIGDISEHAGFSKGAFFSNFDCKESLLLEILRRHKTEQIDRLRALWSGPDGIRVASPELDGYFAQLANESDWTLLDIQLELQATRAPSFAVQYNEVERSFREAMAGLIEAAFARAGRALPMAAEQVAGILIALTRGLVLAHTADPDSSRPPLASQIKLVFFSLLECAPRVASTPDADAVL